jgi:spermidine synthase
MRRPGTAALLTVLFVVSGASALAGQVVLNRLLAYVFGASHLATSTVLAAYMGGLALGSALAGRFAGRVRRPILAYGLLELGISAYFASLPFSYPLLGAGSAALGVALGGQLATATAIRFVLCFSFVLLPTVLMGATLPVLLSAFREDAGLTRYLPWLYAANTLGGAAGAFLSGYFLLYALGLDGTVWLCAAASAIVGIIALFWGRTAGAGLVGQAGAEEAGDAGPWRLAPAAVCGLAFAQGALSFSLEVTWSHLARTVIGVTTYAFTLMLTVILLGIGLGSLALAVRARRRWSALRAFVLAQLGLGLALALSLYLWDRFPEFVAASLRRRYEWSFAAREILRSVFVLPLLLPAGIALGVSLPALTASLPHGKSGGPGAWVGRVFGFNTLGAIAGSLVTGFVLLGRVPSEQLLSGAALGALGLSAAGVALGRAPRLRLGAAELVLASATGVALVLFPGWDPLRLTSGKHFMWDFYNPGPRDSLLLLREDAQSGFVTVERDPNGVRLMRTNGKYEGSDAAAEFQDHFALIGAMYLDRFEAAALVGLGPGRTLALLHEMPFRRVEVIEFSPAIVTAARAEFSHVSGAALADSERVALVVDDGRNHLQVSRRKYDYVAVGITGAAFAGVGGLYNREFFEVVRARLAPAGVFLLWIQLHHIFPEDVRSVAYSLRHVFPFVHLYAVPGGQGLLVASGSPLRIHADSARSIGNSPRAARVLASHGFSAPLDLLRHCVISRDSELERWFASEAHSTPPELYTDLRPRFEFTTPMGLATRIFGYDLAPFASPGLPDLAAPPAEAGGVPAPTQEHELGRAGTQRRADARHRAASSSPN